MIVGFSAVAVTAQGGGTLDQQQTGTGGGATGIGGHGSSKASLAQTFTAGRSGTLDQVDLHLKVDNGSEPLTVEIRDVANGFPDSTVLSVQSVPELEVPPSSHPDWVAIRFTSPVAVQADTEYAIVAYPSGGGLYGWSRSESDVYARGSAFHSDQSPPSLWRQPPFDLAFKTYVASAPRYVFTGFATPIKNGLANTAKAGRTIPVKYRLTTADGAPVSDPASFVSLTSQSGGGLCGGRGVDVIETYGGGSGLQYLGDGDWQFNWKTPKSHAGCRTMTLTLSDDSTHTATFNFM